MDNDKPQGSAGDPAVDSGRWRAELMPDARQRIINKITETLKRHLPFSGEEGELELKKIAVRFEEKIYSAATSQSDYLRKISLKMLTMETKSQNPIPDDPSVNSPAEPADVEQLKRECWCKFRSPMVALKDNPSGLRRLLEVLNNFTMGTTRGDATEQSKTNQA